MWSPRARAIWMPSCMWNELDLDRIKDMAELESNGRERAQDEQRCEP